MKNNRLLVIANAAMNQSDSNGRTIRNFLSDWDKDDMAQFFTYGSPDFEVCSKYYKVSDKDALKSFIKCKTYGGPVVEEINIAQNNFKKKKKTPLRCILREIVWKNGHWKKQAMQWIKDFSPEVILLYIGDSSFLIDFAISVANKFNIPIVVYSCENYYFKDYNYLTKRKSLNYYLLHKSYKKSMKQLTKKAVSWIFISDALRKLYQQEFPTLKTTVIMTASELKKEEVESSGTILYAGNLGVGRHKVLMEVAQALQKVDANLKLTVYGKCPSIEIENDLCCCDGIEYKGFHPYEEIVKEMRKSRLLIHVESADIYHIKDLQYAFSTKIPDSLTIGVPLLCYASLKMYFMEFLKQNNCAFIVENKENLKDNLKIALDDKRLREKILINAERTTAEYFNAERNRIRFQEVLKGNVLG